MERSSIGTWILCGFVSMSRRQPQTPLRISSCRGPPYFIGPNRAALAADARKPVGNRFAAFAQSTGQTFPPSPPPSSCSSSSSQQMTLLINGRSLRKLKYHPKKNNQNNNKIISIHLLTTLARDQLSARHKRTRTMSHGYYFLRMRKSIAASGGRLSRPNSSRTPPSAPAFSGRTETTGSCGQTRSQISPPGNYTHGLPILEFVSQNLIEN